jgi:hypothetical protein
VLPSLVEALRQGNDDEKLDALGQLAQIMDTSYGEDAVALCEFLRVSGCIGVIARLLSHAQPEIFQTALLYAQQPQMRGHVATAAHHRPCALARRLVGNIASEAVDRDAAKTKALLKRFR